MRFSKKLTAIVMTSTALVSATVLQQSYAHAAPFHGTITMYAGGYGPPSTQITTTAPQATALANLAKQYEKLHPGITIQFVATPPASTAYSTWVITKASGGQLPDITLQNPLDLETFPQGTFVSLGPFLNRNDPYVPGKKWKQLFQPQILSETSTENGLGGDYVVSGDFVATAFYYNKSIFKKAGIKSLPTTWSQFIKDCAILKKDGYIPFAWDASGSSTGEDHNMTWMPRLFYSNFFATEYKSLEFTHQNGMTTEDQVIAIKKGIFGIHDAKWMALWPIMKQFSQYWQPDVEGGDDNGLGPMLLFIKGNVGMYMDASPATPQIQAAHPSFKWGTFHIPRPDKGTSSHATSYSYPGTGGPYGGSFNYAVSSSKADSSMTPAKEQAVINWLEFISTPTHDQQIVNQIGEYIPSVVGSKPRSSMKLLMPLERTSLNMVFGGLNLVPSEEDAIYRAYQGYISGGMSLQEFAATAEQQLQNAANQLIAQNHWNLSKYGIN